MMPIKSVEDQVQAGQRQFGAGLVGELFKFWKLDDQNVFLDKLVE